MRALLAIVFSLGSHPALQAAAPDYADVQKIFQAHCMDCHSSEDPEGKLVLENFDTLMKGGQSGAVLAAGKSGDSLLIKFLEGRSGKTGKNQFMPPGKRDHLPLAQITLVKAWIDAGAKRPAVATTAEIRFPDIKPRVAPPRAIHALAHDPGSKLMALGQPGALAWANAASAGERQPRVPAPFTGHRGNVNALLFARDGLYAAGGDNGFPGELRFWNVKEARPVRILRGHRAAIYAMAITTDGSLLATGSYDQKIILWNTKDGAPVRELSGHSGAIFGLSFRADGKVLASASADATIKLWSVATGARLDTFSQPLKAQHAVAFTPDGARLVAAGGDNRIRMWTVSATAVEGTNALLHSQFAHEGAILKLAFSPDGTHLASAAEDKTLKLWQASDLRLAKSFGRQPDWPTAIVFADAQLYVGRQDGSLQSYPWKP